jgi:hypothetical protein
LSSVLSEDSELSYTKYATFEDFIAEDSLLLGCQAASCPRRTNPYTKQFNTRVIIVSAFIYMAFEI